LNCRQFIIHPPFVNHLDGTAVKRFHNIDEKSSILSLLLVYIFYKEIKGSIFYFLGLLFLFAYVIITIVLNIYAEVVELADALDSKSTSCFHPSVCANPDNTGFLKTK